MIGVRQVMPEQEKGLTFKSPALIPNTDSSAPLSLTFNGRSLVLNQLVANTYQTEHSATASNNYQTLQTFTTSDSIPVGHVICFMADMHGTTGDIFYLCYSDSNITHGNNYGQTSTSYVRMGSVYKVTDTYTDMRLRAVGMNGDTVYYKNVQLLDLTLMFGAGKEPTSINQLKSIIDLDSYIPYNPGMLIHANNEWDIDRFNQLRNDKINGSGNGLSISTNSDKLIVIKNTATDSGVFAFALQSDNPLIKNHKYFIYYSQKETTHDYRIYVYSGNTYVSNTGRIQSSKILTADNDNLNYKFAINTSLNEVFDDVINLMIIDLTDIFGAGKEPTSVDVAKAYFKGFGIDIDTYQPYTPLGSVYSDNGRVDLGFNIWDEEWENGIILNGQNSANSAYIRSKNYIPVEQNQTYFYRNGSNITGAYAYFSYYNANKTYLSTSAVTYINSEFSTPANTAYIRFYVNDGYGNVYKNDICINKSLPTTTNNTAYNFRKTNTNVATEDREDLSIVGGTVAWNQLIPISTVASETTFTDGSKIINNGDGSFTIIVDTGGATATRGITIGRNGDPNWMIDTDYVDHKALVKLGKGTEEYTYFRLGWKLHYNPRCTKDTISKIVSTGYTSEVGVIEGTPAGTYKIKPQIFDLTLMFGSTIADYIYSLGDINGPAYFRNLFPKPYYAYNAGELISVNTSAHKLVGRNQFDVSTTNANKNVDSTTGALVDASGYCASDFIKVLPSTTYRAHNVLGGNINYGIFYYDASKQYVSCALFNASGTAVDANITIPANMCFVRIVYKSTSENVSFWIHWNSDYDSAPYEPYQTWSYPLDNTLTLRGIPKLDANNKLYYDGDTYKSDGTVTKKYGIMNLGNLSWQTDWYTEAEGYRIYYRLSSKKQGQTNFISSKYPCANASDSYMADKTIAGNSTNNYIYIKDSSYASQGVQALINSLSGVYLVYELATPTTETAPSFTVPQKVSAYGTEEFIDTRDVAIPVGNNTTYFHHGNLYNGKYLPYYPMYGIGEEFNIWDEKWELGSINGQGELVDSSQYCRSKNYTQIFPNTTYCLKNTTNSGLWLYYYDSNKTFIPPYSSSYTAGYRTFVTPSNAYYIKLVWYGTSYDNGTCINVSQSNTSVSPHNGDYRPYPIKNTFDCISGELVERVGIVDLGSLTWTLSSSYANTFYATFPAMKHGTNQWVGVGNIALCEKYLLVASDPTVLANKTGTLNTTFVGTGSNIVIKDTSYSTAADFKTGVSGVMMVYELDIPITSKYTYYDNTYRQMGQIDLGTLTWSRYSANYPTTYTAPFFGNQITNDSDYVVHCTLSNSSYTYSFKAVSEMPDMTYRMVDSIRFRNDAITSSANFKAAMSGVILTYEMVLTPKMPQPAYLLNGKFGKKYGVVDLGTLTWSYSSSTHRMYIDNWANTASALLPVDDNTNAHLVCAKYKTATAYQTQYNQVNAAISLALSGALCVYDSTYTDANDFKAAMQGIYLIYELAQPVTGSPTYASSANYIREVDGGVKGMSATIDYYFAYDNVRGKLLRYGNKIIVLEGGVG